MGCWERPGERLLRRRPTHAGNGVLIPREWQVVRLVARGLSNRGIADELVISPATVARHVTNILTKLGFASRAQIAVWAVGNDRANDS
ncbi:helix-turn-helix transcriptional regulator [Actinomadura graeca]|uniref:Helix-turn-helix transcriptional regulator n=1 Tax=Actinomadura graeca TaxID=2750812 RepID=A0ABX8QNX9_9ACTN|nr:helix-turn-helix transcriptional regulator [Actinomadura graeca]